MILQTNLPNKIHQGKVRDTYRLDASQLLMVATDRISAFDVILKDGIPGKGQILNKISQFWFEKTSHIINNHFISMANDPSVKIMFPDNVLIHDLTDDIANQSMIVRQATRIDVECVVRGYITGSAWSEYKNFGTVSGQYMAKGLIEGQKLSEPMFTPTTKAEYGHDENMSKDNLQGLVGTKLSETLETVSKEVYNFAHEYAIDRDIILADTKMEFGLLGDDLILIDELLTPDSSRFWEAKKYVPGKSLPSYDKQLVRNWLQDSGWDKESTPPNLPPEVIQNTIKRYTEVYELLSK